MHGKLLSTPEKDQIVGTVTVGLSLTAASDKFETSFALCQRALNTWEYCRGCSFTTCGTKLRRHRYDDLRLCNEITRSAVRSAEREAQGEVKEEVFLS